MKSFYLLISFLVPILTLNGQGYEMEWGNIPRSDREMQSFAEDPEAGAVLLGEIGHLDFRSKGKEFEYILRVHRRIKLLRKSAFDRQATISIPYYHHNESEWMIAIEAQTITPDGRKHPLSPRDFYYEKKDQFRTHVNFTFPQLQEGVVLEYRFAIRSDNIVQPRTWYFQREIPVRFSQLSLHNDSYLSFATLFEGAEYMDLQSKTREEVRLMKGNMRFRFSDEFYLMENAPAVREEAFMTTVDDYRVRLRLQLSEVLQSDGFSKPFLSTWEQSARDLIDSQFFGGLYRSRRATRKLHRLVSNDLRLTGGPEHQMRQIYHYLVNRIHWNGRFGVQPERKLHDAFQTGRASAAELNFMLLALLNTQGIEAHPVLTSTRHHGRITQRYPLMDQFNYVMVMVSINGRTWLLDPTDPLRPPGMPGLQALNKKAWVVNPDWPQWINLEVPPCRDFFRTELHLQPDGRIQGNLTARYTSYSALLERQMHRQSPRGRYWEHRLQQLNPEATLDSVSFNNTDVLDEPFGQELTFNISETGHSFGDFIYLPLVVHANFSENPFKQRSRNFPVDFPYPFEEEWQIQLHIPTNLEVVELPQSTNYSLPDQQGSLRFECSSRGNMIILSCHFAIHQDLIKPALYPQLKQLFDHYGQLVHSKVVLRRL